MTDHIWKAHASNCLVAVEVRRQLSSKMGGEGCVKKIVRYFHILVWCLLIICSKKACGLSWKICQQYSISPSSALYFPCLLSSGSCFPPMETLKNKKKSASVIAWAQTSHNTDSKALKLWLSFLIPCSKRTEGMYMFTPSRHEAPCQIYYSENTTFSPKGKWHPEWQQEIMRVLVLARAARSPSDRGFSPYRNCKKQQTTKVCSPFGAVSRFPHTYTLQSSFLPPLSWVMAILFIKIYI